MGRCVTERGTGGHSFNCIEAVCGVHLAMVMVMGKVCLCEG